MPPGYIPALSASSPSLHPAIIISLGE